MQKHPSADKTGEPINSKKIGSCNIELQFSALNVPLPPTSFIKLTFAKVENELV